VPTPREQLAEILKKARLDAGFPSHAALANRINVSRPVVSKAENPVHPLPSDGVLAAWAGATGAPLDRLTDLARTTRSGTPEWFMPYLSAEATATMLRCWCPLLVPGLLQTEDYARAVLAVDPHSPEELAELLATRMGRQQVIGRAHLTAVIDHTVLRRCLGSPTVMAEQCAHLLKLAERPDVAIHVVPEGENTGLWGAFDIAARDNNLTVRFENLEDTTTTAAATVGNSVRAFERILGAALPRRGSADFVRSMEEEWKQLI
jgi:transcriptional regulator with XRE-family HTH domain